MTAPFPVYAMYHPLVHYPSSKNPLIESTLMAVPTNAKNCLCLADLLSLDRQLTCSRTIILPVLKDTALDSIYHNYIYGAMPPSAERGWLFYGPT